MYTSVNVVQNLQNFDQIFMSSYNPKAQLGEVAAGIVREPTFIIMSIIVSITVQINYFSMTLIFAGFRKVFYFCESNILW
jgi:hypothetical protein